MVMVVLNKNSKAVTLDPKRFAEILKCKSTLQDVISQNRFSLDQPIPIDGKSAVVFEVML
jgi:hypothetical protein